MKNTICIISPNRRYVQHENLWVDSAIGFCYKISLNQTDKFFVRLYEMSQVSLICNSCISSISNMKRLVLLLGATFENLIEQMFTKFFMFNGILIITNLLVYSFLNFILRAINNFVFGPIHTYFVITNSNPAL